MNTITLLKANESTSQLQQGQIAMGELFPAHQQPPEVIEPSMQPLNEPPPRPLAQLVLPTVRQLLRGSGLAMITVPPVRPHMGHVAPLLDGLQDAWIVIGRIHT